MHGKWDFSDMLLHAKLLMMLVWCGASWTSGGETENNIFNDITLNTIN